MAQHDRLHDALRFDRRGQFRDALVANVATRLILTGMDLIDRRSPPGSCLSDRRPRRPACDPPEPNKRVEPASEASLFDHATPSPPDAVSFQFSGQRHVRDCAARLPVVEHHRQSVARRFGKPDVPRNDRSEHFFPEEFQQLPRDVARQTAARIIHRAQDALYSQPRIGALLDALDRFEQRRQALRARSTRTASESARCGSQPAH